MGCFTCFAAPMLAFLNGLVRSQSGALQETNFVMVQPLPTALRVSRLSGFYIRLRLRRNAREKTI